MNKTQYYMKIAETVSLRSTCLTRKVGAVLVKNDTIISTGYNGTPRGMLNCNKGGCKRCEEHYNTKLDLSGTDLNECNCLHAEENAIIQAARNGISTIDSILYCELSPCFNCCKLIINAGIARIYFKDYYASQDSIEFLGSAGISVEQIEKLQIPALNNFDSNLLGIIFEKQAELQNRPHIKSMSFAEQARVNTLAAHTELSEALQTLNWKPWRDRPENRENFKEELVDVFHFFINLCLLSGMNADELAQRYFNKNKINAERMNK